MKCQFGFVLGLVLFCNASHANELPREQWMDYMETALPTYLVSGPDLL
jgi:hypothetical protein